MPKQITPSLIVSIAALVVAASGTTYAATQFSSKDIKDGSIENRDLRPGVVTMSRLKPTTQALIRQQRVPGPKGDRGEPGERGAVGPQGPPGMIDQPLVRTQASGLGTVKALCPPDTFVISGGYSLPGNGGSIRESSADTGGAGPGWQIRAALATGTPIQVTAYAFCAQR